jgi:hypothetical protein
MPWKKWGFHGDLMRFYGIKWDLRGDLMGFHGDLMGFNRGF